MPKGKPNKKYTGEFKQMVVETMRNRFFSHFRSEESVACFDELCHNIEQWGERRCKHEKANVHAAVRRSVFAVPCRRLPQFVRASRKDKRGADPRSEHRNGNRSHHRAGRDRQTGVADRRSDRSADADAGTDHGAGDHLGRRRVDHVYGGLYLYRPGLFGNRSQGTEHHRPRQGQGRGGFLSRRSVRSDLYGHGRRGTHRERRAARRSGAVRAAGDRHAAGKDGVSDL